MQNSKAGSTGKLNDNERYGSGEPKKSKKNTKLKKSFSEECFGQILFLVALTRKKWGKFDVATLIVTGFSLRVTLARYGVDFVYLREKKYQRPTIKKL
jgi:hypothetical protein